MMIDTRQKTSKNNIDMYIHIYSIIKTGVAERATSLCRCSVNTSQAADMGSMKKPGENAPYKANGSEEAQSINSQLTFSDPISDSSISFSVLILVETCCL